MTINLESKKAAAATAKRIRRAADKLGITPSSVTLAHQFTSNPGRLWWFGVDGRLVSGQNGMTDDQALEWIIRGEGNG